MAKSNAPKTTNLTTKVAGVTIEIVKKIWSDASVSCDVTLSIAKAELVTPDFNLKAKYDGFDFKTEFTDGYILSAAEYK